MEIVYLFQFQQGEITIQKYISSKDKEKYQLCNPNIRESILKELFGTSNVNEIDIEKYLLPNSEERVLPSDKVISIQRKFWQFPREFQNYYPSIPTTISHLKEQFEPLKKKIKKSSQ